MTEQNGHMTETQSHGCVTPTFDVVNGVVEYLQELFCLLPILLSVSLASCIQHVAKIDGMNCSTSLLIHLG